MSDLSKIIRDIEVHSVEGIRDCFRNGLSPNDIYNDLPLVYELISEYARTPRFSDCVRVFIEYGLDFPDEALLFVLSNNAKELELCLEKDPEVRDRRYDLRCAYTPLRGVTLLHVCAEFNHVDCARVLLKHGADVNAVAATDHAGFGGQTPVFHTVNQNNNNSRAMLDLLIDSSADLQFMVKGIVWGEGYLWETFIPAVNPISYAMMGLLPQMHRKEKDISEVITLLVSKVYGIHYDVPNIPNKYLMG